MAGDKEKNLGQIKDVSPKDPAEKASAYCASLVKPDSDGSLPCPWCAWTSTSIDTKLQALGGHLKSHHRDHMMAAWWHKDMGLDAFDILQEQVRDEEILDHANPNIRNKHIINIDELDVYDHLWITPEMKKRADRKSVV